MSQYEDLKTRLRLLATTLKGQGLPERAAVCTEAIDAIEALESGRQLDPAAPAERAAA